MDTFQQSLAFTLTEEGGWSDNPADSGGCTMHGITLMTYRRFTGNYSLTPDDLRAIDPTMVATIYEQTFWTPLHCQELPLGVDLMVFDAGANMGGGRSATLLQQQLGVPADGAIGAQTVAAAVGVDGVTLIGHLALAQAAYYRSLDNYNVFGQGWLNRVHARRDAALALTRVS